MVTPLRNGVANWEKYFRTEVDSYLKSSQVKMTYTGSVMTNMQPEPEAQLPPQAPVPPYGATPATPNLPAYPGNQSMLPPLPSPSGAPTTAGMYPTRGMYTAAAVINWVTLGIVVVFSFGLGLIAAAWFIPMTIFIHKGAKGPYRHTGLAVCTLLFCNIISGILMLVNDSNRPRVPVR